jgi:hypothetical protein
MWPSVTPWLHPSVSPSFDRHQVVLQSTCKPGECLDATGHRLGHPPLQVSALALPDHGQQCLTQPRGSRDARIHLTELVQIPLCVASGI